MIIENENLMLIAQTRGDKLNFYLPKKLIEKSLKFVYIQANQCRAPFIYTIFFSHFFFLISDWNDKMNPDQKK